MMFKVISLGALAFSPVAIANQQVVQNQNQSRAYPKIFEDVFESFFSARDSKFDNGDYNNSNFNVNQNQAAFQNFKNSPLYSGWKGRFESFLDNLDNLSKYDLPATLNAIKQDKSSLWNKPKFSDYANFIKRAINELPNDSNKEKIKQKLDSLPFIKRSFNINQSKTNFYGKMLEKILDEGYRNIPSKLMFNNLRDLKDQIDQFNWIKNDRENIKIQFKDFLRDIQNNGYGVKDLENLYKNQYLYEDRYSKTDIERYLTNLKYKDNEKYKELFKKFDDILAKNDIGNINLGDFVNNLSPNAINSIIKNEEIFRKLGSNSPTMNSIQKGLTIAGGFGTLLISFFTAALAMKLILIKSSRRAIALSSTGTITLFGTGVALIILAFI